MTTSNSKTAEDLRREIHNFYWGVWSELGVSGWGRTHEHWAIDPEPVIVYSPSVIASEPRLRDEATDWCIRNWRHVSAVRLRHLLSQKLPPQSDEWGEFAATVNRFSGHAKWPRATDERKYATTGRSTLRSLSEPSMIYLRMRSIFGLGARTEVIRYLLFTHERSTAAMLATQTNYAKRNVAEASEALVQAGVLLSKQVGNRLYFSLADARALEAFLGPRPLLFPDWSALLRVVNELFRWTEVARTSDDRLLTVLTHQAFNDIKDDLESEGLERPEHPMGGEFVPIWRDWSIALVKSLALGEWPAHSNESAIEQQAPRRSDSSRRKVS
jgi:hypothetical protein